MPGYLTNRYISLNPASDIAEIEQDVTNLDTRITAAEVKITAAEENIEDLQLNTGV